MSKTKEWYLVGFRKKALTEDGNRNIVKEDWKWHNERWRVDFPKPYSKSAAEKWAQKYDTEITESIVVKLDLPIN